MSIQAAVQTQVTSKPTITPVLGGVLQRACACGQHTGSGGECEECKKKRQGTSQHTAVLQTKLVINEPGDEYEQEADRVADQVLAASVKNSVSNALPRIQGYTRQANSHIDTIPSSIDQVLATPGQPLEPPLRRDMEERFGHDFSRVRVHSGTAAEQSAKDVNAHAYTVGHNIVFGAGEYAPETSKGRQLLAHELTHVIQQVGRASQSTLQRAETDTAKNCGLLVDSKSDVNNKINKALSAARTKAGKPLNAENVIDEVFKELGENPDPMGLSDPKKAARSPIEIWASTLGSTKVGELTQDKTKYKGVSFGIWNPRNTMGIPFPILNPTLKVNGICIGTDKLGHFIEIGYGYYQLARRAPGGTTEAAEKFGERDERTGHGLMTTGVFSNADLEANRQGLKFYDDIKANPAMTFDIVKYISSKWNEESNPNFYESSMAKQVWSNLLSRTWKGTINYPDGSKDSVTVYLSATTSGLVTGTYEYKSSSGKTNRGMIKNGKLSFTEKQVNGQSEGVSSVDIQFEWSEGATDGYGVWSSINESHLTGTWGVSLMYVGWVPGGRWDLH